MERGWGRPKSGSKGSCAPGQELVGPASCSQIKEQNYRMERAATAAGYKSFAGMTHISLTIKIDHLELEGNLRDI